MIGLNPSERAILAVYDTGETDVATIAALSGYSEWSVKRILSLYASNGEQTAFRLMARAGSAAMLAAIAATGRGYA